MSWIKRNPKKKVIKGLPSTKIVIIKQALVGLGLAILLTVCGYAAWHISRIDSLTLKEVGVVGGETVPHNEIVELVNQKLDGWYFHFIPRRFAWTYPEAEILAVIKNIDRIKNVHLEREGGEKLLVAFEEYRPVALWCQELESKNCLFLDNNGYAFAMAPVLQGGAFLRYSENGREPEVKTQAFLGEFIEETNIFMESAYNTLGLNIIQVEKQTEDDINYHIAGGGVIKSTSRMSTDNTLENLTAILGSKEFDHIEPGNFRYIDLRFGNKVFVNEVLEDVATTTASSTDIE